MKTRDELDRERRDLSDADKEFYFRDDINQYAATNGEMELPVCGSMYPDFSELFALTPPSLRSGLEGVFTVTDATTEQDYPSQFTGDDIEESQPGDVWVLLKPGYSVTCFDEDDCVYDAKALFVYNKRASIPVYSGKYVMLLDGGYETVE